MKCRLLQKTAYLRNELKNWNEFRDGCEAKNWNLEKSDETQFRNFLKQVDNPNWAASTSEKKKGGKRGRKGKKARKSGPAIPDTATTNSADMAAAIGISDVGFKYSEDDYNNITSLKVGRMLVYAQEGKNGRKILDRFSCIPHTHPFLYKSLVFVRRWRWNTNACGCCLRGPKYFGQDSFLTFSLFYLIYLLQVYTRFSFF